MIPYYVVKKGEIEIVAESGDTVFIFSRHEAEHAETVIRYFMEVLDDNCKPELQKLLDFVSQTPSGLTH